jgi:hypothetical protein
MCVKMKKLLILCLCLCLVSCSSDLAGNKDSEVTVIKVQISTTLTHWIPKMTTCSENLVDAGVTVDILPRHELNIQNADLVVRFGPRTLQEQYVSVLSMDRVIFIIDVDNPLASISSQNLSEIFLGHYQTWDQVPEMALIDPTYDLPISVFSYGDGSDLYPILLSALLGGEPVSQDALYAASWEILQGSVAKTPGGIGYLLESQVSADVLTLQVEDQSDLQMGLEQPVIAVTGSEPEGALRQLLLCLQVSD